MILEAQRQKHPVECLIAAYGSMPEKRHLLAVAHHMAYAII